MTKKVRILAIANAVVALVIILVVPITVVAYFTGGGEYLGNGMWMDWSGMGHRHRSAVGLVLELFSHGGVWILILVLLYTIAIIAAIILMIIPHRRAALIFNSILLVVALLTIVISPITRGSASIDLRSWAGLLSGAPLLIILGIVGLVVFSLNNKVAKDAEK
ncbi:MAG: hypothetical protein FWE31_00180 [Firmicutes bacterium]|nr:hypothetical protein [Bacillota bacterium]